MLFFRTISLVTALAFATLSSAVPVGADNAADVVARDMSTELAPLKRSGSTIEDSYNSCYANVVKVLAQISVAFNESNYDSIPVFIAQINVSIEDYIHITNDAVGVDVESSVQVNATVIATNVYNLTQAVVDTLTVMVNATVDINESIENLGGQMCTMISTSFELEVSVKALVINYFQPLKEATIGVGFYESFKNIGIYPQGSASN